MPLLVQRTVYPNCKSPSHSHTKVGDSASLICPSRLFLSKGPSAAKVDKVELIKHDKDASEENVKALIGSGSGFEVR